MLTTSPAGQSQVVYKARIAAEPVRADRAFWARYATLIALDNARLRLTGHN
jgi:hypothetical protein